MSVERVIVRLRSPVEAVPPTTHLRGTVLVSAFPYLRDRGLEERYWSLLPTAHAQVLRDLTPRQWVPLVHGGAHYEAMGEVLEDGSEFRAYGRYLAERVQGAWAATVIRGLRAAGLVNPTVALGRFQASWDRVMRGGAGAVVQVAPREVRVECRNVPLVRLPIFRDVWCGMFEQTLSLVADGVRAAPLDGESTDRDLIVRITWR